MDAQTADANRRSLQEIFAQRADFVERESREHWMRSLAICQEALRADERSPEACIDLARCHRALRNHEEALAVLRQGTKQCRPSLDLYKRYVNLLERCNRAEEASGVAHEAAAYFPDDLWFLLKEALVLPILYDSAEDLGSWRRRFETGLAKLSGEISLAGPENRGRALAAVGEHVNVHLGYQAGNDRELQVLYGNLLHGIMAANYPQWARRPRMRERPAERRLRVGYLSSRFRNLSATKYFFGWLRGHDREKFEVHAYQAGPKNDAMTNEVRRISSGFRCLMRPVEDACAAILADELDVLIFLDVGLDPFVSQLAALRLAPIQCLAWDQPITSGLPTIDYFLSSALAEPEDARGHYSEELVRLPGVGVNYAKPVIPTVLLTKTRADFGLREDAVVYLCCQYVYKYLPEQDGLLAQIAKRVPQAQFVFLPENSLVAGDLRKRLKRAFGAAGLRAEDYCVLLSPLDRFSYWNLYLLGDAALDTIGWTGGVSTFEAIACHLPVVTMPGQFMRGRQSYAILTQMGATDTIAYSGVEYVDIAVRLGVDRAWRDSVIRRMDDGQSLLYSDTRSVSALEEFYRRIVDEGGRSEGQDTTLS